MKWCAFSYLLPTWLFLFGCHPEGSPLCISYGDIPPPPYDNPVWHPNEALIGFNYIPIKEVRYKTGSKCSPHAEYIFEYDSAGFWLVNVDGTNQRRVITYPLLSPAWSPDGKWIVFGRGAQIFKMAFDGQAFDTARVEQLTEKGRNFFPTWSPDGEWIAFDSDAESPTGSKYIWKMRSDGSSKRRIALNPEKDAARSPYWGPNFNIVHYRYTVSNGLSSTEVFEMDSSGGNLCRITTNDYDERWPRYSYDGKILAFISLNPVAGMQVVATDSKGKSFTQVTTAGASNFSFSPDGRIVYTHYNYDIIDSEKGTLWIVNQDGSDPVQLTFNSALENN
ncbi:hypothetical protein [uncultured Imperialibacter sp.]|uniref:TolB family protein n=1 Tax=uncultured Imperialibacter sp. TaxID=1672639 RepID=UPI0030DB37A1|tara:strand:+ start:55382 stop:56386 length:1005 start_codon:yes stop_codon:yes gene_type:complete